MLILMGPNRSHFSLQCYVDRVSLSHFLLTMSNLTLYERIFTSYERRVRGGTRLRHLMMRIFMVNC